MSTVDTSQLTFAFIGAGNMSGAILGGMVNAGFPAQKIIATNRSKDKQASLHEKYGVVTHLDNANAISNADVVVLGVKPQMMKEMLQGLVEQGVNFSNKLVITVAAGLKVQSYKEIIGEVRFIRAMPNTPSLVGEGVTGIYSGTDMSLFSEQQVNQDIEIATSIFSQVGKVILLEQEIGIDHITALSGSGPAYFFLFMEYMSSKAQEYGFSKEQAEQIVMQTGLGAASMAKQAEDDFAQLRKNVTSPGGSTEAAITNFQQNSLESLVTDALDAAVNRTQEMSKF